MFYRWLLTLLLLPLPGLAASDVLLFSVSRTGAPLLDPHRVQGDLELHLNPNLFEGLYKIDPKSGALLPALATSHRWITKEVVEFTLRKGVSFHNGEPFDAHTVAFNFERMAGVGDGFNWIKALLPQYRRTEVVDSHTVRIHFSAHPAIFLISSRFFVMLPPKLLQERGDLYFLSHPVGTGPFYLESITKEANRTTLHLKKFKHYWEEGYPKLSGVEYMFGLSQQESLDALRQGKIDAMGDVPLRSLLELKKAGLELHTKGQGLLVWLYFNLTAMKKNAPIYDTRVREAILHAIDYEKILKVAYNNHAKINHQWAFPGLPGYSSKTLNRSYDPRKAQALFKEAGISKGTTFHMYCDDVSLDEAKIIKSSLAALGYEVTIDILDEATNNCILTAKNQPASPCHAKLGYYDFMIGDFGWGLPHNYVSHLHTFSQESFASLMDSSYPGAEESTKMMKEALNDPDENVRRWEEITEFEHKRLGISALFLKEVYYATPQNITWDIYGAYNFTYATPAP